MSTSEDKGNLNVEGNTGEVKTRLYRTSDIYFAAYLSSLDVSLTTTEAETMPDGGRKVVFVFKLLEADLQRLKASYFGGNGTVKARRFVDNIRSLKSMCFVLILISLIPMSLLMCFV
jgi:hypothetical protein